MQMISISVRSFCRFQARLGRQRCPGQSASAGHHMAWHRAQKRRAPGLQWPPWSRQLRLAPKIASHHASDSYRKSPSGALRKAWEAVSICSAIAQGGREGGSLLALVWPGRKKWRCWLTGKVSPTLVSGSPGWHLGWGGSGQTSSSLTGLSGLSWVTLWVSWSSWF